MPGIKTLNDDEMPREKLINHGPQILSKVELLAIILRVGTQEKNVIELSREILNKFNINQISRKTYSELLEFKGIKKAKATQIVALFELSRRFNIKENKKNEITINNSKQLYENTKIDFSNLTEEKVMIILVNSKNKLIKKEFINHGSINYSIIDIRKILKNILLFDASGFFLIHNHPSGNETPSLEDKQTTSKIYKLSQELNIRFLDHIIIGNYYYSFFENDNLK